ncbi:MAG: efflux RND transporter periplasmic adaptor subunit [bacterium]
MKKKSFLFGAAGLALTLVLVIRTSQPIKAVAPLSPPTENPFSRAVAASGIVESIDENIRLSPAVSGLVKSVKVTPGQSVHAGDLLLELDDRDLYGQWLVQKANLQKLSARMDKLNALKAPEALSAEERDNIRHDFKIAQADLKRIELLLDRLKLRSPIDGNALQVNTRVGEFIATPVNPNDSYVPPLLLGRRKGFQVRADVDEINARYIKAGAKGKAFVKGEGNAHPIDLTFVRIDPYVIPKKSLTGENTERVDTRVLQVIFQTGEVPDLYVGQQLDVYIEY